MAKWERFFVNPRDILYYVGYEWGKKLPWHASRWIPDDKSIRTDILIFLCDGHGQGYRLVPKSFLNWCTSSVCQSPIGSRRPKKNLRLEGSSTNFSPPIIFLYW